MDLPALRHPTALLTLSLCCPLPCSTVDAMQVVEPVVVDTVPLMRITIDRLPDHPGLAVLTPDHRIVVVASNGRALVSYDAQGRQRWIKRVTPGGSGGFAFFFGLLHEPAGERVGVWDHLQNRLTWIDADGRPDAQRRLHALPMVSIGAGGRSPHFLSLLGVTGNGEIIARTSFDPGAAATVGLHQDSTEVVRVDARGSPEIVRRVLMAEQFRRSAPFLIQGTLPFGRTGSIAVGNGSWYYTDGTGFVIERRTLDGTLMSTFGVPRSRRVVTVDEIRHSRLRSLADVDSALKSSMINTLAWMPYPDSMPAYADLHVDRAQLLWAEVAAPEWEPARWDLFDPVGRHLGEVRLPPGLHVLDIAADALLAYHVEPGGDAELRLYRLRRSAP